MIAKALRKTSTKEFIEILNLNGTNIVFISELPKLLSVETTIDKLVDYYKNMVNFDDFELIELNIDEKINELIDMLKSDSVYTLLRFGAKSPSKSGVDNCEDDAYYDLYNLCCDLRKKSKTELKNCMAGSDGECNHPNCPQMRDGEPEKTGRFCPLPHWSDEEVF